MIYILANSRAEANDYAKTQSWLKRTDWRYLHNLDMVRDIRGDTVWVLPTYRAEYGNIEWLKTHHRMHVVYMPTNADFERIIKSKQLIYKETNDV
jgi:hypothetical protein